MKPNRFLSHLRTIFCALAIIGVPLAFPSAEASGPPLPAQGGFSVCFSYAAPPRQAGENLIIMFNISGTLTGTFTGSFIGTELDIVHRDGSITKHGSFVFTGSVTGRQGTGALAGVYDEVTVEGDVGAPQPGCNFSGAGTYSGQIVFAP